MTQVQKRSESHAVEEPKISVVITTFNRAALLLETLHSLKKQTVPVDEIVVVNDGGTDDTQERIKALDFDLVYVSQKNAGMQAARNFGIRNSSHRWIAFSDDDDLWLPDRCAKIKALLSTHCVEVVASDFSIFDETGIQVQSFFDRHRQIHPKIWEYIALEDSSCFGFSKNIPPTILLPESPFWGSQLVVDRKAIQEILGWDESVRGIPSEDLHFVYRILKNRAVGLIMSPTLLYRSHTGNVSRDDNRKYLGRIEIISIILKTISDEDERAELLRFIKEGLSKVYWSQVKAGDLSSALITARRLGIKHLSINSILRFCFAVPKYLYRVIANRF